MSIFSFYRNRKPRKFEHKPIYWDPRREALEERIAKVKKEMGVEEESEKKHDPLSIKGSFVKEHTHLRRRMEKGEDRDRRNSRNVIIAVVLVLLLIVFYYLYF